MIMAEEKMLKLIIVLTVVTSAVLVIPARSQELSLTTSGADKNFSAPAGESLNVICQGLGDDNQKVSFLKWLDKEGNVISEGVPGTLEGENNSLILTFSDPKIEESGNYTCTALFDGKSLEKIVLITFYMNNSSKPDFQLPYENVTAEQGLYHEMFCLADGEQPITYEWYDKFGTQISKSPNSSIYTMKTGEGCTLIIPEVTLNDGGLYACTANNQHGLSTKLFQLTLLPLSGNDTSNDTSRIMSFRAINITSTSVKFAFNFSGPVRYIKVLYNESRSATKYFKEWKYGESYEIKNLIPGGLYSFIFRSVPSLDDRWSTTYRVVLLPGVPEVIFRYVGSGTVTLSWFRAFDDIMRSTIDRYELAYSTVNMQDGNTWKPNSCNITIQIPECAGSTYTISGLSRNIFYQIQLRAHTVSGYGEPNKQKIFMPQ